MDPARDEVMPTSARPDVLTYMDAYTLLGVEYAADSSQIRRAYLRLVRRHHPDTRVAGSVEQQEATALLARVNEAYALVRDAPLRYHRASTAADPETPWTDTELEEAISRARLNRKVDLGISAALVVVMVVIAPLLLQGLGPALSSPFRAPVYVVLGLASSVALYMFLGPRAWHVLYKIQVALAILQFLKRTF